MDITLLTLAQIFVALGIYNVWILRYNKETKYRGGNAKSIKEEFKVYGLSHRFMMTIGVLKVSLATLILIGIWIPLLAKLAAAALALLMLGAVSMHIKVKDSFKKALPATAMFILSTLIALLA